MNVTGMDHIVLTVADAERSLEFYVGRLGLAPERLEEWRAGAVPFVSVRVDATTVIDLMEGVRTGVNTDHVALVVEDVDLEQLAASGEFEVVRGVGRLWGAQGVGLGMHVADPDGNLVELRTYG